MDDENKVTLHMVSSLDGFIANKDESADWFESEDRYEPGKILSEEDIGKFLDSIQCYIMGSRTYDKALQLGWLYADVPVVVLTNKPRINKRESVRFYSGDLVRLVQEELKPKYQNIWIVGGAKTAKEFLQLSLIDEIIISIMPIILGDGTLFFDYIGQENKLHLKDVTAYKDGMVELSYELLS